MEEWIFKLVNLVSLASENINLFSAVHRSLQYNHPKFTLTTLTVETLSSDGVRNPSWLELRNKTVADE